MVPADGAAATPAYAFASEPTLGFYRSAAGTMAYTGTLIGAKAIGEIFDYAGSTAPAGSLPCDGQPVSRSTYAALFAAIGTTWGAGDGSTTFNLPNLQSRFRRHRDTSSGLAGLVGNTQGPVLQSHAHAVIGNTGNQSNDHTHGFSGTTGSMNQNASHSHSYTAPAVNSTTGGGAFAIVGTGTGATTGATNTDHQHAFSGNTGGMSANHTHPINLTSGATVMQTRHALTPPLC